MPANYAVLYRGYGLYDEAITEHGEDLRAALESQKQLQKKRPGWVWPHQKAMFDVVDIDDPERGSFCEDDLEDLQIVEAPDGTRAYSAYPEPDEKIIEGGSA